MRKNQPQALPLENVMMRYSDGTLHQLAVGVTYGKALDIVWRGRASKDGNNYWIGTMENHT